MPGGKKVKHKKIISNVNRKYILLVIPVLVLSLLSIFIKKVVELSADPLTDCRMNLSGNIYRPNLKSVVIQKMQKLLAFVQLGGTTNDISCLNETPVYGIIKIKNVQDIKDAMLYAKENNLKVSISGAKHSMGGQAFYKNSLVLDMREFNKMTINDNNTVLTTQSGAIWHDIQNFLDPKGLSVKAMQSSDIFTVGGSISVNAHGMDHHIGSISSTIRSLRIMKSDGSIETLNLLYKPEIFKSVIGGYGLFGVIIDADIEVTKNAIYDKQTRVIDYKDFPDAFNQINADDTDGLFYGHLTTGPSSFLKQVIVYEYKEVSNYQGTIPALHEQKNVRLKRFFLNLGKTGNLGSEIRYLAEKYIQPRFESCITTRNQAIGEPESCYISRNQDMHESAKFLRNNLKNDTDILQEYFIPRNKFIPFVDGMREILQQNKAVVLNAGIRVVNKEDITLNYAPEDSFAMVLYLNQKITQADNKKMEKITKELIDLSIELGGKPYLPYQLYYTKKQLVSAYPSLTKFFNQKREFDPSLTFTNSFFEKYN